ncbi:hypothetical protein L484_007102 [Morus notabilis]|uniref:Secreted protein n=1 Tax=Morus notabilis TaxID=981085 RepID=W9S2I4_9ROSA|nr:hypothetical protein L484_007102 [Morus notabilis]
MKTKWWLFLIWAVVGVVWERKLGKSQTKSTILHSNWSDGLKARNTSETLSPTTSIRSTLHHCLLVRLNSIIQSSPSSSL